MAAFVASHAVAGQKPSGVEISNAYMKLAEQSAAELEEELRKQATSGFDEQGEVEQRELKAKITMCHYLVIIACGCSAEPGTVQLCSMAPYAAQLCKNMLLVCPELLLYCLSVRLIYDSSVLLWNPESIFIASMAPYRILHSLFVALTQEILYRGMMSATQHPIGDFSKETGSEV